MPRILVFSPILLLAWLIYKSVASETEKERWFYRWVIFTLYVYVPVAWIVLGAIGLK
jgi:hypothetical protein